MRTPLVVVGLGRMGSRWAELAASHPATALAGVVETDDARGAAVAARLGCARYRSVAEVPAGAAAGAIVAVPNAALAGITRDALARGLHVLCEKPAGTRSADLAANVALARERGLRLMAGFNHRFHPALAAAKERLDAGEIGRLLFVRGVYGHGGRQGYGEEWRGKPELAGGGELLDQGVHLIDLARHFLGEFASASGIVTTSFWPVAPLEDNGFALLKTADGAVASLHASWTLWRNVFAWEVIGERGYLRVDGLGFRYGPERLTVGVRPDDFSTARETSTEFPDPPPGPDGSLRALLERFRAGVESGRDASPSGEDALAALRIVEAVYRSSVEGVAVPLGGR